MIPASDLILPFQIESSLIRGRLVRLSGALEAITAAHAYPETVGAMLGETVALAALLASGLKYDGIFILQTQGNGPIPLMVADVTSQGAIRAYARFDADGLENAALREGAPVPRLLGGGHMAFTVDQGPDSRRYQGIAAMEGGNLADCAMAYFRDSEQLATAIRLATHKEKPMVAGIMLQRMPGGTDDEETEENWRRAVTLMSSVQDAELLDRGLAPDALLYRLFHEDGIRVFEPHRLSHACRCSQERIRETLLSLPEEQLSAMFDEMGRIDVACEFCGAKYVFRPEDVIGISHS